MYNPSNLPANYSSAILKLYIHDCTTLIRICRRFQANSLDSILETSCRDVDLITHGHTTRIQPRDRHLVCRWDTFLRHGLSCLSGDVELFRTGRYGVGVDGRDDRPERSKLPSLLKTRLSSVHLGNVLHRIMWYLLCSPNVQITPASHHESRLEQPVTKGPPPLSAGAASPEIVGWN